jgi:hypothetical protein
MMRAKAIRTVAGLMVLAVASRAWAEGVVNGGFESGRDGWDLAGGSRIDVRDSYFGVPAPEGEYHLWMGTGNIVPPLPTDSSIEAFLGLAPGSLDALVGRNATGGCAIKQTVVVQSGDQLVMQWDLATLHAFPGGPAHRDFAFAAVDGDPIFIVDFRSHPFDLMPNSTHGTVPYLVHTGYHEFSCTFEESGAVSIGFGVMDAGGAEYASMLMLDDIRIEPVPTPGTLALLGVLVPALVRRRRRRRGVGTPLAPRI